MNYINRRLFICGAEEIDNYCAHAITHIIRIVNPGVQSSCPSWFNKEYLQLSFGDVVSETDAKACRTKAPNPTDISQAIDFCRKAYLLENSGVLISCDYGASRSPALAYVVLADQMGINREQEALEEIIKIRPDAVPNTRVVSIGDQLLCRKGALLDALQPLFDEIDALTKLMLHSNHNSLVVNSTGKETSK